MAIRGTILHETTYSLHTRVLLGMASLNINRKPCADVAGTLTRPLWLIYNNERKRQQFNKLDPVSGVFTFSRDVYKPGGD